MSWNHVKIYYYSYIKQLSSRILGIPFLSLFLFSVSICNANSTHDLQDKSRCICWSVKFLFLEIWRILSHKVFWSQLRCCDQLSPAPVTTWSLASGHHWSASAPCKHEARSQGWRQLHRDIMQLSQDLWYHGDWHCLMSPGSGALMPVQLTSPTYYW